MKEHAVGNARDGFRGLADAEPGSGTQRIIAIGFTLVLLLMVTLTAVGLTRLSAMKQRMVALVTENDVKIESVYQMRSLSRERFASLGQIVVLEDPFERDDETMRFQRQAGAFIQARDRLLALGMRSDERAIWQRARQLIQRDEQLHARVLELAQAEQRHAAMELLLREVRPVETALLEVLDALASQYRQANQASLAEAEADFRRAEMTKLVLLGLALSLSFAIAWAVMLRVQRAESALAREREAAVAAAGQLSWAASHDALTGLANRREMQRRLAELVQGARLRSESHVLLFIDLDHFKAINDRCGHQAGDEALRQVAGLFQRHVRSGDLVARVGGDEFCIGLANCEPGKANQIACAIRDEIAHHRFAWQGQAFVLGTSIGLVRLDTAMDVDEALSAADAACYRAKAAGRNQVSPASQEAA